MGDITANDFAGDSLALSNPTADEVVATIAGATAATATAASVLTIQRTTSGNMTSTFGGGIQFNIEDDTSGALMAAQIFAVRDSVDNTGYLRVYLNNTGSATERFRIQNSAITAFTGLNVYYGNFTTGNAAGNRGTVTAFHGSGGNTPGYLLTYSPNGTPWYWFAEDDGTARIASAAPTQNSDGQIIGLQF